MLTAVIIDDENNALDLLKARLEKHCSDIQILACCNSGEKGIDAITKLKPDLVFLDIEMPGKNGFDVLNETKQLRYAVIFTTAYDQFAIKAIKYAALDYLLKPIDIEELKEAVNKALQQKDQLPQLEKKIELLLSQLQHQSQAANKIAIPVGNAIQFFAPDEIVRCESDSNYSSIFFANGKKVVLTKTLKEVEESFGGLSFYRIHNSHLVNLNHITQFSKAEGYVIMSDGTNVNISRNRKEEFMELFRSL